MLGCVGFLVSRRCDLSKGKVPAEGEESKTKGRSYLLGCEFCTFLCTVKCKALAQKKKPEQHEPSKSSVFQLLVAQTSFVLNNSCTTGTKWVCTVIMSPKRIAAP